MERYIVTKNRFGHWNVQEGEINPRYHGPFMDFRDALEQVEIEDGHRVVERTGYVIIVK